MASQLARSRPKRSSPHDHPSISDKKTSKAIRACSLAKSCAELPDGNDSKKKSHRRLGNFA